MGEFNILMTPWEVGQYALDLDLEQDAKRVKGFNRFIKRIWWYHYNRYSNPLMKSLLAINIIGYSIAVILPATRCIAAFVISVICYIWLLCDRGFGEPECPY